MAMLSQPPSRPKAGEVFRPFLSSSKGLSGRIRASGQYFRYLLAWFRFRQDFWKILDIFIDRLLRDSISDETKWTLDCYAKIISKIVLLVTDTETDSVVCKLSSR